MLVRMLPVGAAAGAAVGLLLSALPGGWAERFIGRWTAVPAVVTAPILLVVAGKTLGCRIGEGGREHEWSQGRCSWTPFCGIDRQAVLCLELHAVNRCPKGVRR